MSSEIDHLTNRQFTANALFQKAAFDCLYKVFSPINFQTLKTLEQYMYTPPIFQSHRIGHDEDYNYFETIFSAIALDTEVRFILEFLSDLKALCSTENKMSRILELDIYRSTPNPFIESTFIKHPEVLKTNTALGRASAIEYILSSLKGNLPIVRLKPNILRNHRSFTSNSRLKTEEYYHPTIIPLVDFQFNILDERQFPKISLAIKDHD